MNYKSFVKIRIAPAIGEDLSRYGKMDVCHIMKRSNPECIEYGHLPHVGNPHNGLMTIHLFINVNHLT